MSKIPAYSLALQHLKHYLSPAETRALASYYVRASELQLGKRRPQTDAEQRFVEVCRGNADPQSQFELIWMRFHQARRADERIDRLADDVKRLDRLNTTLIRSITELKEQLATKKNIESSRISQLHYRIEDLERQLGIAPEPRPEPKSDPYLEAWREQP